MIGATLPPWIQAPLAAPPPQSLGTGSTTRANRRRPANPRRISCSAQRHCPPPILTCSLFLQSFSLLWTILTASGTRSRDFVCRARNDTVQVLVVHRTSLTSSARSLVHSGQFRITPGGAGLTFAPVRPQELSNATVVGRLVPRGSTTIARDCTK